MSTETWQLPWTQSPDDFANSQDVVATINGSQTTLLAGALMNVSKVNYDFPTDAAVEWWVVTFHQNGTDSVASAHMVFTAVNKAQLQAAIPGAAVWVKHNP